MKKKFNLLMMYVMLFIVSRCGKQDNTVKDCSFEYFPPAIGLALNCEINSFMEGASTYSDCCNAYIIKGIVLDKIEYGLKIELLEDLKGNFPENIDTFIVWGDGDAFIELNRLDNLSLYNKQNTLIMHLVPAFDQSHERPDLEWLKKMEWLEKPEDYTTIPCAFSVLELSNGYVKGCIFPSDDKNLAYKNYIMPLNNFENLLKITLK